MTSNGSKSAIFYLSGKGNTPRLQDDGEQSIRVHNKYCNKISRTRFCLNIYLMPNDI